ncbi:hypothetical protein CKN99_13320 [Carnobacterium maltaromaticum]|uniref:GyrI-like domain-containing protein n=1 Tax=Carnobacterium TaxID=2747 RepID=UPI000704EC7C|nr:GyrI-like domain-containing protein [Carnobacterium maltaromaticum]KRN85905.1 hypothetical protein IV75_GL001619 [Carnobacterium maltaromaticum]MDT1943924.1 GyrI-like domain-containing protein [Carnobacterium maltaromaticum]MDT1999304.1 GyrI-like domain-containing protein [Carnobacterium maltaromaticum]TFJ24271.1 hypothetical protein CKN90_13280 [Carnobacterium maltaromaticum]TFJ29677.1 hypothetical protein CKN98_13285 [Carnobacterium maltaromaticum]
MKYEWRKKDKFIYIPKAVPTQITLPSFNYLTIEGKGNPNSVEFQEVVGALYAYSYAIRMLPKKGIIPEGYFEYTVFPLEGFWTSEEKPKPGEAVDKDTLIYQLMIRQPDFVSKELVASLNEEVAKKIGVELAEQVQFQQIEEGQVLQMLHVGSYDTESITFAEMEAYCEENNLEKIGKWHKEIYLSDPRKVIPDKQKTTLRFPIRPI